MCCWRVFVVLVVGFGGGLLARGVAAVVVCRVDCGVAVLVCGGVCVVVVGCCVVCV